MATQSTGLENSIRQSWSAGSKVKILSSQSNDWVIAHIVTIQKKLIDGMHQFNQLVQMM